MRDREREREREKPRDQDRERERSGERVRPREVESKREQVAPLDSATSGGNSIQLQLWPTMVGSHSSYLGRFNVYVCHL